MTDIITLIKNNSTVISYVNNRIYANYSTSLDDCIVYTYNTTYNDRCVKRQRLKITIIAKSLATVEALEDAIITTIAGVGDKTINGYTSIVMNGGGDLFDTDRDKNHRILYFDIITRGD